MNDEGLRHNEGKTRLDLLTPTAVKAEADVLAHGLKKYAPRNWEKGMPFSTVLASLKRHLLAFERGEDFDSESGLLHMAHVKANASFIVEYYSRHPKHDDRNHWYRKRFKKVWIDIDSCVLEFEEYFLKYMGLSTEHPTDWDDFRFRENMVAVINDENFWKNQPANCDPKDFIYPITGYCTSRSCPDDWTIFTLKKHGFPKAKFHNVRSESKSEFLKSQGCDFMLDDSIHNFMDCQRNGISCYLKSRPHNLKYDVGHWRVSTIREYFEKVRDSE